MDTMIEGSENYSDTNVTPRLKLSLLQYQEEWGGGDIICCHGLL